MQCRFQQFTLIIGVIFCTAILYFYYSNYNFDFVTNSDATTLKFYKSYHRTNSNTTVEDKIKESVIAVKIISTAMSLLPITTTTIASILASTATKNLTGSDVENDSVLLKISKEILELKKKKGDERKHLLKSKFLGSFYGIIAPEAECPNLVRIGKLGDGGKWICNSFVILKQPCTFYSLGLNNEVSFDVELMEITKNQCKHIAVDMNEQSPEVIQSLPNTNFLKGKISKHRNETVDEYTMNDLMLKYNTSKIDIMKMDIEGSEYDILDQLINIPICQLLVELHTPNKDYRTFYQWLNAMSKAGFYLLHFEINEGTLQACEFTLIHRSCLKDFGVTVIKQFLS